jgi:hypothetical protein
MAHQDIGTCQVFAKIRTLRACDGPVSSVLICFDIVDSFQCVSLSALRGLARSRQS